MKKYLIPILFFSSFAISSLPELKASENICEYSTVKEHKKCINQNTKKLKAKYPIENFSFSEVVMSPDLYLIDQAGLGNVYKVIELRAESKDKLEVTSGDKSVGWFGITDKRPFISKKTIIIPPEYIISLNQRDILGRTMFGRPIFREYKIKYLDDFGEIKVIEFQQLVGAKDKVYGDMAGDILIEMSGLIWGEEKSDSNIISLINKKLLDTERKSEIIGTVIAIPDSSQNNCLKANKEKYPDLVQKYKRMIASINPLRKKLNLGATRTIRPVCN